MDKSLEQSREKSDPRLRASLKFARFLAAGSVEVSGLQNVDKLDKSEKILIASTHITDVDIPIAASVLADKLDLSITGMSLFNSLSNGVVRRLFIAAPGKKHFNPIPYDVDKNGVQRPSIFNRESFVQILQNIDDGKKPIIAAHAPLKNNQIPTKPGIAVPYLASTANSYILPVAVEFYNKDEKLGMAEHRIHTLLAREALKVTIGEPFKLEEWPDGQEQYKSREQLSSHSAFLRAQGQIVLNNLVNLLDN